MRINGVGSEYADLLEAAGVDSCAELAQRNAANLAQTFQELDAARPNWIRQIPSEATVAEWIERGEVDGVRRRPLTAARASPAPRPRRAPWAPGFSPHEHIRQVGPT